MIYGRTQSDLKSIALFSATFNFSAARFKLSRKHRFMRTHTRTAHQLILLASRSYIPIVDIFHIQFDKTLNFSVLVLFICSGESSKTVFRFVATEHKFGVSFSKNKFAIKTKHR